MANQSFVKLIQHLLTLSENNVRRWIKFFGNGFDSRNCEVHGYLLGFNPTTNTVVMSNRAKDTRYLVDLNSNCAVAISLSEEETMKLICPNSKPFNPEKKQDETQKIITQGEPNGC